MRTRILKVLLWSIIAIGSVWSCMALFPVLCPKAHAAAALDEAGPQTAEQADEPRQIKRLVVWKATREENAMAVPANDAGSWQKKLIIAGHCNEMLSADIKIYVEVTPPEAIKDVLWRVREMDSGGLGGLVYTATPKSGTFAAGNPVTCTLRGNGYRYPCSTVDYWVEVGFDENGNGTLEDDIDNPTHYEAQLWVPIHYVPLDEYQDAIADAQATLVYFLLPPTAWAAYDNMLIFLGSNPGPGTNPVYNCDLELNINDNNKPQWQIQGGVYLRGCGVTGVPNPAPANAIPNCNPGETFTMPLYGYPSNGDHGKAIHDNRDDMGPAIFTGTILPKAVAIAQILANDGDGLYSITSTNYPALFAGTAPVEVTFAHGDAYWAYLHAALQVDSVNEIVVAKSGNTLTVKTITVSGSLWDVWHFYDDFPTISEADVQAAYEPGCDRTVGKVFQEQVDVTSETININTVLP